MSMLFKPYYIVQAYSPSKRRLVTHYLSTELSVGKELMSLKEAQRRGNEFAASLNEAKRYNATDWIPSLQLMTDKGKIPLTK